MYLLFLLIFLLFLINGFLLIGALSATSFQECSFINSASISGDFFFKKLLLQYFVVFFTESLFWYFISFFIFNDFFFMEIIYFLSLQVLSNFILKIFFFETPTHFGEAFLSGLFSSLLFRSLFYMLLFFVSFSDCSTIVYVFFCGNASSLLKIPLFSWMLF